MNNEPCAGYAARMSEMPLDENERRLLNSMIQSLPRPDAPVEQVVAGDKFIAVVAGGRTGISSLLGARPDAHEASMTDKVVGMSAVRVAEYLLRPSPFAVCLGMAALNAASTPDPSSETAAAPAEQLIAELGRNKTVGLVGQFPFVEALREKVGALHLFELREAPGAVPREHWEEVLPRLDVLALTATALLTRQMAFYLSRAANAVSVVLGPTTPMSPALFGFGVDYLCGSMVTDPRPVLEGIRAGLPFRAIKKRGGISFFTLSRLKGADESRF